MAKRGTGSLSRRSSRVRTARGGILFRRVAGAALLLALRVPAEARSADEALRAQSLLGPTGYVTVPSADTLSYRQAGFALHRFLMGMAYGWPRNTEFGVSFDLREVTPVTPFTRDTYRARAPFFNLHAKHRFLNVDKHWVDASVGVIRHTYYLAVSPPTWQGFRLEAGPSLRRRTDDTHEAGWLAALSLTADMQAAFVDFDSQTGRGGLGWRGLLSDNIRIDLSVRGLGERLEFFDRIYFGLTITGDL